MLSSSLYKKNMIYRVLFFCALSLCLSSELKAKVVFNMTDNCLKAQAYLYELKLDEADKLLATEASANSDKYFSFASRKPAPLRASSICNSTWSLSTKSPSRTNISRNTPESKL